MSNLDTPKARSIENISILQFIMCFAIVGSTTDIFEDNAMSQGNNAVELTKKNASLSEMPDDILTKIVGMLDLKTAVITTVLSKRWKHICYKMFESVLSLTFESVNVSNLELVKLIERCPSLEELALHTCSQLTELIIGDSTNTRLKILSLHNCLNLREIDLGATNVNTLECSRMPSWLSFKINTPCLVNVFASESRNYQYPLSRLSREIPMLENLILSSELSSRFFKHRHPEPPFYNLRRLVMSVSPFNFDDKLVWVSYILKVFPLLETLELNVCSARWRPREIWKDALDNFPNGSISRLELNGFVGKHNEVYLLKYLLENLTGLRWLGIGPSEKVYTSFNRCFHKEASNMGRDWFANHSQWVRTIVPRSVHLEFLEY